MGQVEFVIDDGDAAFSVPAGEALVSTNYEKALLCLAPTAGGFG